MLPSRANVDTCRSAEGECHQEDKHINLLWANDSNDIVQIEEVGFLKKKKSPVTDQSDDEKQV
jgi:hypothetical protein